MMWNKVLVDDIQPITAQEYQSASSFTVPPPVYTLVVGQSECGIESVGSDRQKKYPWWQRQARLFCDQWTSDPLTCGSGRAAHRPYTSADEPKTCRRRQAIRRVHQEHPKDILLWGFKMFWNVIMLKSSCDWGGESLGNTPWIMNVIWASIEKRQLLEMCKEPLSKGSPQMPLGDMLYSFTEDLGGITIVSDCRLWVTLSKTCSCI